jgi:hypothetical protein
MKCNVGKTDRILRYILGGILIVWGIVTKNWWGAIGLIPILTALLHWCPLYIAFGTSTCSEKCESNKK